MADDSRTTATPRCPECGAVVSDSAAAGLCPACLLQMAVETEGERFLPGMVIADRYRVVARLGAGGMGEVYRADDMKLGQPVALKFLPERLQDNPALLERFLEEVKLARQVSHPNVCRVYDVGEVDGQHFLSMEYVDGEDLGCLLQRIGRAPRDKAVQIAWQLCSGLAAIHARGILHRDLKPANVMLDGRGQVRITDFGVAGRAEGDDVRAMCGTPAYMAPEQLSGQGASLKSDLYSLGLVLFETFTGKPVFESGAARRRHQDTPPDPALLVDSIDPTIGSLIHSCLEPDPDERPSSVNTVLTALPATDPLQAALVAGETPPPELVAAAGGRGRLDRRIAAGLIGFVVAGTLLLAVAADDAMLFRRETLRMPPEALADRAQELLRSVGYDEPPGDIAYGFGHDRKSLDTLERESAGWERLSDARPAAMYFWYRQGSERLSPGDGLGKVSPWDPPAHTPGTANVVLDTQARLLQLLVVPTRRGPAGGEGDSESWARLFEAAVLDLETFVPADAHWVPPLAFDEHHAWDGNDPEHPEIALHVEAAVYDGRPVFFRLETPWGGTILDQPPPLPRASSTLYHLLYVLVIIGCIVEARRNLRQGRGDRIGARRLAVYILSITLLQWLLAANHAPHVATESQLLVTVVGLALFKAILLCWVPYIALEPHIRRHWPQKIVSWTRLLAGRFRDPLVGRDLLIGVAAAVAFQLVLRLYHLLPLWLGRATPRPETIWPDTLLGARFYISEFFSFQDNAVFFGFGLLFLLLLVQFLVKSEWLAAVVVAGFLTLIWFGEISTMHPVFSVTVTALRMAGFVLILKRFGVLAVIVAIFFDAFLNIYPVTISLSEWYAESSVFALAVVLGLATYAVLTCVGPRNPKGAVT